MVRDIELAADLELAIRAARAAGAVAMRSFGGAHDVVEKAPGQPVTQADLEADRVLRETLLGERPGDGWLSEETVDNPDRLRRRRVWIVDPIDGTRSYIAGRPEFAVSVALAVEGVAVVGVVYNPAADELYWAVQGGGAWLEAGGAPSRRLSVTPRDRTGAAVLLASRSEIAAGAFDPFHGGWRIEPVGSTAYKMARIAAGAGDVFLSRGPKSEWDVCAGGLLIEEAGGRATDLRGRSLRYNRPDPYVHGIIATNAHLHATMLDAVEQMPPIQRERTRDPLHPGFGE